MTAKRLYEGMFLVDSTLAAADWEGTLAGVENILKRADAEVVVMRKWGERKLAYDIDHKTRGTYILCYFKADSRRVAGIEKDVQLSEKIMRVLILATEDRPPEMIEQDIAGLPRQGVPEVPPQAEEPAGRRRPPEEAADEEEPAVEDVSAAGD
jgi:small subunit ribosomal protein S6